MLIKAQIHHNYESLNVMGYYIYHLEVGCSNGEGAVHMED